MKAVIEKKTLEDYLLQIQELRKNKELKKEDQQEKLLSCIAEQIAALSQLPQRDEELESFFKAEQAFYSGHYERALMLYMQARTLDLFEFFCYRATAFVSSSKGNSKKALDFLEKALQICPEDSISQELQKELSLSSAQEHLFTSPTSKSDIDSNLERVSPTLATENQQENQDSCDLYHSRPQTLNFDSARQSQIEALRSERRSPSPSGKGEKEDQFGKVVASQNSKFEGDCGIKEFAKEEEFESKIKTHQETQQQRIENYLERFLSFSTTRDDTLWFFDGWEASLEENALPQNFPAASGGIYLRWAGKGIVINPGEHFLKRFHAEGIHFRQIDAVIATEDSPSIHRGIEEIYAFNSQLNAAKPSKFATDCGIIHYYLNLKTYQQLAHRLKPRFKQERNTVHSLGLFLDSSDLEQISLSDTITMSYLTPIPQDSVSSNTSQPLAIRLDLKKRDRLIQIGYLAGSPAWTSELTSFFESSDLLIAGCRPVHPYDGGKLGDDPSDWTKVFTTMEALIAKIKPKLLLVTGFEGSQGDLRLEIVRKIRKAHESLSFERNPPVILPADCGMVIDLETNKVKCSLSDELLDPLALQVVKTGEAFSRLHYLSPENLL